MYIIKNTILYFSVGCYPDVVDGRINFYGHVSAPQSVSPGSGSVSATGPVSTLSVDATVTGTVQTAQMNAAVQNQVNYSLSSSLLSNCSVQELPCIVILSSLSLLQ